MGLSWQEAILKGLKAPHTTTNVNCLTLWEQSEGGLPYNNPFFTTLDMPHGESINSAGAKRYASLQEGVEATVRTLEGSYYTAIVKALQDGKSATKVYLAINKSPWCSGCQNGHYPVALYDNLLAAAGSKILAGAAGTVTAVTHGIKDLKVPDHGRDPTDYHQKVKHTGGKLSEGGSALQGHAHRMTQLSRHGAPVRRPHIKRLRFNNPNRTRRVPKHIIKRVRLPHYKRWKP